MSFDELARRLGAGGVPFRREASLAPLTCLGVGGAVPVLAEPRHAGDFLLVEKTCSDLGLRLERLGSGANLLVAAGPLPFAALALSAPAFHWVRLEGERLEAGAGVGLEGLVRKAVDAGLAGLEGLVGIPATLGGALAMNAGSRHAEVSGRLVSVRAAAAGGELKTLPKAACGFAYRRSLLRSVTLLSAEFALSPGRPEELREKARAMKEEKARTQPLREASAGCIFRNPPGDTAGRLIEAAGLKGLREGGAQVSPKHANFIVNLGGATADELRRLIDRVQGAVRLAHGVDLQLEVVEWP